MVANVNRNNSQIPLGYSILDDKTGYMTQPWAFWFQNFQNNLPPPGSSYVINGSNDYPTITINAGPDNKRGQAKDGTIYYSTDTHEVWFANGDKWLRMIPAFHGDVTSQPGSTTLTLAPVGTAGTYGDASHVPVITTDSKGRITNVTLETITSAAGGTTGSIQYNDGGVITGDDVFTYSSLSGTLSVPKENIGSYNSLSIQDQGTGEPILLSAHGPDEDIDIQLDPQGTGGVIIQSPLKVGLINDPGQLGQVLVSKGPGLAPTWAFAGPLEWVFHYGDATPMPLVIVPADMVIMECNVFIKVGFNGTGASISVGTQTNPELVMAKTDSNINIETNWSTKPGVYFSSDTQIYLFITAGAGASQGEGLLEIILQESYGSLELSQT